MPSEQPLVTIVDPHAPPTEEAEPRRRSSYLRRHPLRVALLALALAVAVPVALLVRQELHERQLDRVAAREVSVYLVDQGMDDGLLTLLNNGSHEVTVTGIRVDAVGFRGSLDLRLAPSAQRDFAVGTGFRCDPGLLDARKASAAVTTTTHRGSAATRDVGLDWQVVRKLVTHLRARCGYQAPAEAITVREAEERGGRVTFTVVNRSSAPVTIISGGTTLVVAAEEKGRLTVPAARLGCGGEEWDVMLGVTVRATSEFGEDDFFLAAPFDSPLDTSRCWEDQED